VPAAHLLRRGLLDGVSVLVAGTTEPVAPLGAAVDEVCTALGARVQVCAPDVADEAVVDEMVAAAVVETGSLDLLVLDGASLFGRAEGEGPGGGRAALQVCLDASWNVTRAAANRAFLPGGRGGRIVYLAPSPDAGEHADAARAGLENLARTLSIEWARHGVTTVAIAVGARTAVGEVAALTAYLASPAGAYFSGCLLDLRGAAAA
jgi:NAD(P)-dependent dehydrogenase (short-subunit alcohol dehydrogenase family)